MLPLEYIAFEKDRTSAERVQFEIDKLQLAQTTVLTLSSIDRYVSAIIEELGDD